MATNDNNANVIQVQAEYIKKLEEKIKQLESRSSVPTFEDELREIATIMYSGSIDAINKEKIKIMQFLQKHMNLQFVISVNGGKVDGFGSVQTMMLASRESAFFWEKYPHTSLLNNHISKYIFNGKGESWEHRAQPYWNIYESLNNPKNLYVFKDDKYQCSEIDCKDPYHRECGGFSLASFKIFSKMMSDYKEMTELK